MKLRNILIALTLIISMYFQLEDMGVFSAPPPSSDDVVITYTPIILPTVNITGESNVTHNSARLEWLLDNGNENPDAWIYYSDNTDGGTTPAAWSSNISLGAIADGAGHYDLGGLSITTFYWWNIYVENSEGSDWGISDNFTTTGYIGPPTNLTITDLGGNSVNISWSKGFAALNTIIVWSRNNYPSSHNGTDGEVIYTGNGTSVKLSGISFDSATVWVSGWSADATGNISSEHATAKAGGNMIVYGIAGFIALGLTVAGLALRQRAMLYFGAGAWGVFATISYQYSEATWDPYYIFFLLAFVFVIPTVWLAATMKNSALAEEAADVMDDMDELEQDMANIMRATRLPRIGGGKARRKSRRISTLDIGPQTWRKRLK